MTRFPRRSIHQVYVSNSEATKSRPLLYYQRTDNFYISKALDRSRQNLTDICATLICHSPGKKVTCALFFRTSVFPSFPPTLRRRITSTARRYRRPGTNLLQISARPIWRKLLIARSRCDCWEASEACVVPVSSTRLHSVAAFINKSRQPRSTRRPLTACTAGPREVPGDSLARPPSHSAAARR